MIPYGRHSVTDDDVGAVISVLRGENLTQGKEVDRFEDAVAEYCGARFGVAFSSGTAALHAAAAAIEISAKTLVGVPALSFVASANAIRYLGGRLLLSDVSLSDWNLDFSQIVDEVDAAVGVHFAGLPIRSELLRAAHSDGVRIIEDAAHALGAQTEFGPVGNCKFSQVTCFSFHPVKTITSGEGGIATTNDRETYEFLKRFRTHGIHRSNPLKPWDYDLEETGYNYRMSDIHAALGLSQLKRIDALVDRRNQIAAYYRERFSTSSISSPPLPSAGSRHAYHLFPILVDNRDTVAEQLRARGIATQVHYPPIHKFTSFAETRRSSPNLPITEEIFRTSISIPIFPSLTDEEVEFVAENVLEAVEACSQI